jgi:hypothetical protein
MKVMPVRFASSRVNKGGFVEPDRSRVQEKYSRGIDINKPVNMLQYLTDPIMASNQ